MGTGPECYPSISADGTLLAYSTQTEDDDLIILDRVSGQELRLPGLHDDIFPALLRDGSGIVFVSDRWGGDNQLWLQPLENGSPRGPARRLTDHEGNASQPAVSPDGKWIAYYRIIGKKRDIWIIPTAGGLPVQITDHPASDIHPAWSTDGSELAFTSNREGHWSLYVLPITDGQRVGECRRITGEEVSAYAPVWSPDGETIAFLGYENDQPEAWLVAADGNSPARRLTQGAQAHRIRWHEPTGNLWVSGQWQQDHLGIREVSCVDGKAERIEPPVDFGLFSLQGIFDLSEDGRLVVFCRIEPEGNVWVVETKTGVF
jgi:Tol biopolymer transport system component